MKSIINKISIVIVLTATLTTITMLEGCTTKNDLDINVSTCPPYCGSRGEETNKSNGSVTNYPNVLIYDGVRK